MSDEQREREVRDTVKTYQRPWPVAWSLDQAADDLEFILRLLDAERMRADDAESRIRKALVVLDWEIHAPTAFDGIRAAFADLHDKATGR